MNSKYISASEDAKKVIKELKAKYGELVFHQSGGCCDGSAPMCFEKGEFKIGGNDMKLGEIEGCEFYMHGDQFEFFKHTHQKLCVANSMGGNFSLETTLDKKFYCESSIIQDA